MQYLIIDTTSTTSCIIVGKNSNYNFSQPRKNIKQNETLLTDIEKLLISNKVSLDNIDVFACVTGPGSFTGIRIGISTIKAFLKCTKAKLIALNIFEVFENEIINGVLLIPCTKNSVYYGIFENNKTIEYGVIDNNQISNKFLKQTFYVLKRDEGFNDNLNFTIIDNFQKILTNAVITKIKQKVFSNKNDLAFYIQISQAERNLKNVSPRNVEQK